MVFCFEVDVLGPGLFHSLTLDCPWLIDVGWGPRYCRSLDLRTLPSRRRVQPLFSMCFLEFTLLAHRLKARDTDGPDVPAHVSVLLFVEPH